MSAGSRSRAKRCFYIALMLVGVMAVGAPVALDAYSTWRANQVISTLEDTLDESDDPARLEQLSQAHAYNDRLAHLGYDEPDGGIWPYDDQLSWKGKPYMAYLQVPKAHIKTPIYHGTAEEELAAGVGHLEGRSLPVGGRAATCVLEGHSGMLTSRMFDDIRLLSEGDMLCIWSLAEPYAYEVYGWEVCDPDEVVGKLDVVEGEDKVVLVTCSTTPDMFNPKGRVGINDKRLLVYASRCAYDAGYFEDRPLAVEVATSPRSWPFLALAAVLTLLAAACVLRRSVKRRRAAT